MISRTRLGQVDGRRGALRCRIERRNEGIKSKVLPYFAREMSGEETFKLNSRDHQPSGGWDGHSTRVPALFCTGNYSRSPAQDTITSNNNNCLRQVQREATTYYT